MVIRNNSNSFFKTFKMGPMKKLTILPAVFICCIGVMYGQSDHYGIFQYAVPKNWKQEAGSNYTGYSRVDGGSWAQIVLYKSAVSKGDIQKDLDEEWRVIVAAAHPVDNVETTKPEKTGKWTVINRSGIWQSNGAGVATILTTYSDGHICASILLNATAKPYLEDYKNFISQATIAGESLSESENSAGNITAADTQPLPVSGKNGYFFTSTNFDDGWTATEKQDWVDVTKAGISVRIHYPNEKTDQHHFEKLKGDENAWNILVTPRYKNITDFQQRGIQGSPSITFLTANGAEILTGKKVHIVLFKKHYDQGNGRYIEVVADSKAAFENVFGNNYINTSGWDYPEQTKSWDKLAAMQWRNKFAVDQTDLSGKWLSVDFASISYYYVSTGRYAGSNATTLSDEFSFFGGGLYASQHSGASGAVGNMGFATQKYKGNVVVSNWSISFSNRFKGETETFTCQFEAVKGGRLLILTDKNNTIKTLVKQR